MEPSYFYITALALVAGRLIYDTTFRTRKANLLLVELIEANKKLCTLQAETRHLGREVSRQIWKLQGQSYIKCEDDKCFDFLKLYRQSLSKTEAVLHQVEHLDCAYIEMIQQLPTHIYLEQEQVYNLAKHSWISHKDIKNDCKEFLEKTKTYIAHEFKPNNLAMLKLAESMIKETGNILLSDGTELDMETVRQTLDKWDLNKKLNEKLPPKPKAKVNKI